MNQIVFRKYSGTLPAGEERWDFDEGKKEQEKCLEKFPCRIRCLQDRKDNRIHFHIRAEALEDIQEPVSLALEYIRKGWKRTEYVLMPGAAYDGNRMESVRIPYPPYHVGKSGQGWEPYITDIPHLDKNGKDSCIQLLSGDMSTPAFGFFDEKAKEGMMWVARHQSAGRYTGFTVQEEGDAACFHISCPGVREKNTYFFGDLPNQEGFYPTCDMPSDDAGIVLKAGESLELEAVCEQTNAESLCAFFACFNQIREVLEQGEEFISIPFSRAFDAVREKYTALNFTEEGYYRGGTENDVPPAYWQAGWVGGGMNTYPLLMADTGTAREQSLSTLRFIVSRLQKDNGWYIPMYAKGKAYGDDFRDGDAPVLLVRKDADLLYFLLKQVLYLDTCKERVEGLKESIEAQADAFVRFVKKNGELGQFIDMEREELLEGGTACGAIAPAALALAYMYFGKPAYLETAEQLGKQYWENCLNRGILNGGPGEICQAPDSESAFAFLESCVQLYETTGKERWLEAAKAAFELAITWVVSYDFDFPARSSAKRIGAHTRGTVFANAQNKHSAPGICTLSGNSMLKLYRFTGDRRYLEWMRRISRALSQFVSLPDRPIDTLAEKPLPSGYFNERVQMSDWEGKHTVGEFLYGSNWPEVTMLLTYVEIPGIYVDMDRDVFVVSDHVEATLLEKGEDAVVLCVKNHTPYEAEVMTLIDHSRNSEQIGHLYYGIMKKICVKQGEEVTKRIVLY